MSDRRLVIWECKVGAYVNGPLPAGCDLPMRRAVAEAFENVTDKEDAFLFSGWGASLSPRYAAVVTKVLDPEHHEGFIGPSDLNVYGSDIGAALAARDAELKKAQEGYDDLLWKIKNWKTVLEFHDHPDNSNAVECVIQEMTASILAAVGEAMK